MRTHGISLRYWSADGATAPPSPSARCICTLRKFVRGRRRVFPRRSFGGDARDIDRGKRGDVFIPGGADDEIDGEFLKLGMVGKNMHDYIAKRHRVAAAEGKWLERRANA